MRVNELLDSMKDAADAVYVNNGDTDSAQIFQMISGIPNTVVFVACDDAKYEFTPEAAFTVQKLRDTLATLDATNEVKFLMVNNYDETTIHTMHSISGVETLEDGDFQIDLKKSDRPGGY